MQFEYVIFDLDDTLYPRHTGLMQEIAHRIKLWVESTMGLSEMEAAELRHGYLHKYGTTLGGLIAEHQVDVDAYLAFVHDMPVDQYIRPNPPLRESLAAIPLRKAVFTNATSEHAQRVLRVLGIDDCFQHVIGIREVGLTNKPRPEAYERLLHILQVSGPQCILVEDRLINLGPPKQMGMTTVLVSSTPTDSDEMVDYVVSDPVDVRGLVMSLMEAQHG
jgi:putative hydrolase of the HAD superfamily